MVPYLKRRAVQGRKPNGDTATTIFDLQHDRRHIKVYPAAVDTFAVTVDAAAVHMLATAAVDGTACAVPAIHAKHGHRLLGLRPYEPPGPMELYVVLPGAEIHIVYRQDRLLRLASILTELTAWLA